MSFSCVGLRLGAEIDCEDKSRNTALHIAARYGHELIITALIKHGANPAKLVTTDIHLSGDPPLNVIYALLKMNRKGKRHEQPSITSVC